MNPHIGVEQFGQGMQSVVSVRVISFPPIVVKVICFGFEAVLSIP